MAASKGVLIIGELMEGRLALITRELLNMGRTLAQGLGEELSVVIASDKVGSLAQEVVSYGADKVYTVEAPLLEGFQLEAHLMAMEQVVRQVTPTAILAGRTVNGRDLGPRLAFRLGVGVAFDCMEVDVDPQTKSVTAVRPVYGGNAMARIALKECPYVIVARAKVFEPAEKSDGKQGEVVPIKVSIDPSKVVTRHIKSVKAEATGPRLEDARIVVSGGRGLGKPENFKYIEELAKLLGGAPGASRAIVDEGWVPYTVQIGLSGKTVTPDLYIAVGISGASQHMAGCSGSKVIVAIDKNPEANIFKDARFGVVGDWSKVLPALIEKVREMVTST